MDQDTIEYLKDHPDELVKDVANYFTQDELYGALFDADAYCRDIVQTQHAGYPIELERIFKELMGSMSKDSFTPFLASEFPFIADKVLPPLMDEEDFPENYSDAGSRFIARAGAAEGDYDRVAVAAMEAAETMSYDFHIEDDAFSDWANRVVSIAVGSAVQHPTFKALVKAYVESTITTLDKKGLEND